MAYIAFKSDELRRNLSPRTPELNKIRIRTEKKKKLLIKLNKNKTVIPVERIALIERAHRRRAFKRLWALDKSLEEFIPFLNLKYKMNWVSKITSKSINIMDKKGESEKLSKIRVNIHNFKRKK
jgi:hypothetical protein